ncbi:MAG: 16S rRNA (cytidine(1402)-2'-O)-methyltransferase [Chlorobi bacterium]|nr:16S rRNA (cytidine(1402)-2'-O)-methyltransferase [Chlorobiota bacterium]
MDQGRLFVVPTPIGNLEDMTLRGVRLLREIETVACEDTRVTGQLLKHLNIVGKRLISLHLHNERGKADELLGLMESGDHVVLVSDAGTPGLSDPGSILSIQVEVLPGANAAIPALVGSGLQVRPALFEGFLPHKKGRKKRLKELSKISATIVLYESPHRLLKLLRELAEFFGEECRGAVVREMTKVHEEYVRGTLKELEMEFAGRASIKGEIVVIIVTLFSIT